MQLQQSQPSPRRTITMRAIRSESLAAWYEREAAELRDSGDSDMMWNLAADYEQHAQDLREAA